MKVLRVIALMILVVALPSCGETPTSPPQTPPPPPSTPASVTAAVTVLNANPSAAFNKKKAKAKRHTVKLRTSLANAGTEPATVTERNYTFFGMAGTRLRTRPDPVAVPGSTTSMVEDEFSLEIDPNSPFKDVVGVSANVTWAQVSDPSVGGTVNIARQDFSSNLTKIDGREACAPSATTLCLLDQRFKVEVDWTDFQGASGMGNVAQGVTDDVGLFYFFNPNNTNLLVQLLDSCASNDHFWVFASATTNVEMTITVTDSLTGDAREYDSPLGTASPAITDTEAFSTCDSLSPLPVPDN